MPINYLKKIQLGEFNESGYKIYPSKSTESIIEGFYVFSRDLKEHTHLIFNDGFPVLVFLQNCEDKVTVVAQKETVEIKAAWASAGAIKNVYVNYTSHTEQLFIVRFYPSTFYQLFGLSSQYFKDGQVTAFENIAQQNNFGMDEFFNLGTIREKITLLETYVEHSLTKINTPKILQRTMAYIHQQKGKGTVRDLSGDVGVNYKWLERNFVQYTGLLPKAYIQLYRFMSAYVELVGSKDIDLMRIALSNGYYDSNHFLKDFKAYTGKTPLAYLKLQS